MQLSESVAPMIISIIAMIVSGFLTLYNIKIAKDSQSIQREVAEYKKQELLDSRTTREVEDTRDLNTSLVQAVDALEKLRHLVPLYSEDSVVGGFSKHMSADSQVKELLYSLTMQIPLLSQAISNYESNLKLLKDCFSSSQMNQSERIESIIDTILNDARNQLS